MKAATPTTGTGLTSLLCRNVGQVVDDESVALLLSGGMDSLSVGFAAMREGKKIHAYTFRVEGRDNADTLSARYAAERFGWPWTLIDVTGERLEQDFIELVRRWNCRTKAQVECTWPILYVAPRIEERFVVSAAASDGLYGLSRKALIRYKVRTDKALFDRFRREYFAHPNPASATAWTNIFAEHQKTHVAPYIDPDVLDYFLAYDWRYLNLPMQKIETVRAFADEFSRVPIRLHANFQLVAGVPSVFERLLSTPFNRQGRRRVMDLVRDYRA